MYASPESFASSLDQCQQSAQEVIEGALKVKLASLSRWPDMMSLPQRLIPAAARLCALIERKPSAVVLLPRLLNSPS